MGHTSARFWSIVSMMAASACSTPAAPTDAGSDASDDAFTVSDTFVGRDAGPHFDLGTAARPAPVILPAAYDGTTPLPLIILLHADGVTPAVQDSYMHLSPVTRASGAYLVLPNGTAPSGSTLPEWNDGIAFHTTADDQAYLSSVIDQALAMLPVDAHRIYFIGHSNGGFMAYRMACLESARVTGIVAIAAGDFPSTSFCTPARAVSVLHLHGTADTVSPIGGVSGVYAGAVETTQRWAQVASCDITMTHTPAALDIDARVAGAETTATDYIVGCTGARVSLFTMTGSEHIPVFTQMSSQVMVDWLLAQSSP